MSKISANRPTAVAITVKPALVKWLRMNSYSCYGSSRQKTSFRPSQQRCPSALAGWLPSTQRGEADAILHRYFSRQQPSISEPRQRIATRNHPAAEWSTASNVLPNGNADAAKMAFFQQAARRTTARKIMYGMPARRCGRIRRTARQ